MSRLLSRAKAMYLAAEAIYKHVSEDDVYIDICCYNLQQSIEMALKYIVEMTGNNYAENHDLRANLNILNRMNYEFPYEKAVREKAVLLYEWETESRYKESFVAAQKDVEEVFNLAQNILNFADGLVEKVEAEALTEIP